MNRDGTTESARRFLEELPEVVELEANPPINYWWVEVNLYDERYDEALARLESGSSDVFEAPWLYIPKPLMAARIHGLAGSAELERSEYETARQLLEASALERPQDGRIQGSLGVAYAGQAIRAGELGVELLDGSKGDSWTYRLAQLAQMYVMVGEEERALEVLEELLVGPSHVSRPRLKADPTWAPLRDNPRFQALVK